jgi:hypothetical protein
MVSGDVDGHPLWIGHVIRIGRPKANQTWLRVRWFYAASDLPADVDLPTGMVSGEVFYTPIEALVPLESVHCAPPPLLPLFLLTLH